MKSLEYVIQNFKSKAIDNRDMERLAQYISEDRLGDMGVSLNPEYRGKHHAEDFTKENIIEDFKKDIAFGYDKAINQRGISSACMIECVKMWSWILEDGLEEKCSENYDDYGVEIFKMLAERYDIVLD